MEGLTARVVQTTPLVIIPKEEVEEVKAKNAGSTAPVLQLEFTEIDLRRSVVDYRDSVNKMYASVDAGLINIKPRKLDLAKINFDLGDILLQQTKASIQLGKKEMVNPPAKGKNTPPDTAGSQPVRFAVNSLDLKEVAVKFDDDNAPRQSYGMDYLHLNAAIPELGVDRFVFTNDTISGQITKAAIKEQSGFHLNKLNANFLYTDNQAYIKDLYLKTPGTEIKRDIAIRYPSIESLATNIGNLVINADIDESRIQVKDILTFVPSLRQQPAFASPSATWYLDGKINGSVADLQIDRLRIAGFADTRVDVAGRITGLPDANKVQANLAIRELTTSRRDIIAFMPKGSLPPSLELPNRMKLAGTIRGNGSAMNTDLLLATDMGNVSVKGSLSEYANAQRARYDVTLRATSLNLRALLKDTMYGPVTLSVAAKGRGYDMKTANSTVK